mmetsp:Transcript_1518/g.3137  ORF Transcript_1518/g.3137 Transcript_1518/m.3137 type:complete len:86 (-) Transcript_1518:350-607(-)
MSASLSAKFLGLIPQQNLQICEYSIPSIAAKERKATRTLDLKAEPGQDNFGTSKKEGISWKRSRVELTERSMALGMIWGFLIQNS